jgi:hypothetical protein
MARDKSTASNCEDDENSNLLPFVPQKSAKPDFTLSYAEMVDALAQLLSDSEEMALAYLSGYFFNKLLKYHRNVCTTCNIHGEKIARETFAELQQNDIFIYFKLYDTMYATLYKCSAHFVSLVRTIILVTNYSYEKYLEQPGFVNTVKVSVLTHCMELPQFCTTQMANRLISLVARTMLVYKIKWLNSNLKATKKIRGSKKTKATKKLEKLTHV